MEVPPWKPAGPVQSFRPLILPGTWRHLHRMSKEMKANGSARLAIRSYQTGPTSTCERLLKREELVERATRHGCQPLWFCTAAWMRAILAWNKLCNKATSPIISLEFPVSLRRDVSSQDRLGNLISPLVLSGDASQPVGSLALLLKRQFISAIRNRQHLAMPSFLGALRFLPWGLFRRLVLTPLATGYATSHFTWHDHKADRFSNVSELSQGSLQVIRRRVTTPVCLHMGAALVVSSANDSLQFSINYRFNALSENDANRIADLLQSELMQSSVESVNQNGI
jgi:hypothetical protein